MKFINQHIVPELDKVIDLNLIYNKNNTNYLKRQSNYKKIQYLVKEFFMKNLVFNEFMQNYDDNPIERIIQSYVFIKVNSINNKFTNIFNDKKVLYISDLI